MADRVSIPKIVNVRYKNMAVIEQQPFASSPELHELLANTLTEARECEYQHGFTLLYNKKDNTVFTLYFFAKDKDFLECLEIMKFRGLTSA